MGNFTGFQKTEDFYIHPRIGQIKRIQSQDGPQLIQYKVFVQSEDIVDEWKNILNTLTQNSYQSTIFLPKNHYFQRIGFCGKNGQLFLLFDDFMFSLKDEIKNRRTIKRQFQQASIWEILYKLIKVQNFLQENNLNCGIVKPQNIIVNEDGEFRIISKFSYPGAQNTLQYQCQLFSNLYSPEEWIQLRNLMSLKHQKSQQVKNKQNKTESKKYNKNISQIFSIGATILQICTLQQSKQIYISNGTLNQQLLTNRIKSIDSYYSKGLTSLLWQMMKLNPEKRITSAQLVQILTPHQQQILSHKKFIIYHKYYTKPTASQCHNYSLESNMTADTYVHIQSKKQGRIGWQRFTNLFDFLRQRKPQQNKQEQQLLKKTSFNKQSINTNQGYQLVPRISRNNTF